MKAGFSISTIRKRHGFLVRGVAVFFLLFTGADLLAPEYFCGEGEIGGATVKRATTVSDTAGSVGETQFTAAVTSEGSRPDLPPDQTPHEEDCFCCCAHVLPSLGFGAYGASQKKMLHSPPVSDSFPSPPLRGAYHPPRIA